MKHVMKALSLAALSTVLLAATHSHVREHQVPHPNATKVSLAKRVVARPQLLVTPAAVVVVPTTKDVIAIELVATLAAIILPETEQSACRVRGPPCDNRTLGVQLPRPSLEVHSGKNYWQGEFSSTYTVGSDCKYTDEFTVTTGVPIPVTLHHNGFIAGEGTLQEVHYVYSDGIAAVSGTVKKQ